MSLLRRIRLESPTPNSRAELSQSAAPARSTRRSSSHSLPWSKWTAALLTVSLLFGLFSPISNTALADNALSLTAGAVGTAPSPVIVTEILPNNAGADDYEFFELHNLSVEPQTVTDTVYYRYTDNSKADTLIPIPPNTVLLPGETKVFWYNNKSKPLAEFNSFYKVNLTAEQIVEIPLGSFPGFANGGNRAVVLKQDGRDLTWAAYLGSDITDSLGVQYQASRVPEAIKLAVLAAPTPGTVTAEQLVPPAASSDKPIIDHSPIASTLGGQALTISTRITGATGQALDDVTAAVYYRNASETTDHRLPLQTTDGTSFHAAIPGSALTEAQLFYSIQADSAGGLTATPSYSVSVQLEGVETDRLPELLITELVPDTTNIGSSDGYEFIEVYNNTDRTLNFGDYKLYYRYPDKGAASDLTWATDPEDIPIPAQGSIVIWVQNAENGVATEADFNQQFGVSLIEGQTLFRVKSAGMANGSARELVIGTNTHVDVAIAAYAKDDVKANKGVLYQYPMDGSKRMLKVRAGTDAATPGRVDGWQVPVQPVHVTDDTEKPVLMDRTGATNVDPTKDLEVRLEATDNRSIKSVELRYRTNRQADPVRVYLTQYYNDTYYHFLIPAADLIGKEYIEYAATVSDGQNRTELPILRLPVNDQRDRSALRLNAEDGQFIGGTYLLKGTAENEDPSELQLSIDGIPVAEGAGFALEHPAYLAFDVSGVDYYFKNAVTIGEEILYTFMDPIPSWKTLLYPIGDERLKEGVNGIWIRSGSKSGPFDDRVEENKDDFQLRNVRLVLADGTELYDPRFADRSTVLEMGDSAGKHVGLEFQFTLGKEQLRSRSYEWDTTTISDGAHTVAVTGPSGSRSAEVKVDNAAPAIELSVQDGQELRGTFTLDASVHDAISGVKPGSIEATLNDKPITLPYAATSSAIGSGTHQFSVSAVDNVGNKTTRTVTFQVPEENPDVPTLLSPSQDTTVNGSSANLTVRVSDPTGDSLHVGFYRGFQYTAADKDSFKAYTGQASVEPPAVLKPEGERELTEAEYAAIRSEDGDTLTNDTADAFPYHRFEIELDPSVRSDDEVSLEWKGSSLTGRKVSLYAWSPAESRWNKLVQTIPENENSFTLKASVQAGSYLLDGTIHTLVQDEVASTDRGYDFSLVWMSDTQYYSESWPEIYEGMTRWVVDNRDALNIRYVIHTGDIVDKADRPEQWANTEKAMSLFDQTSMPYGVLAGNHDVGHQNSDYTEYWKHYGEDRFNGKPYYGGSYQNNRGHYDLISAGGQDFIFVYMGWNIGSEQIAWVDEVLQQYPERKAILAFHEYLLVSGNRAPIADEIYEHVVKKNKNVFAVLSGHYHDAETLIDEIDDNGDGVPDRKVYQILADYQGAEKGGLGYLRLLQFRLADNQISVKTYSPYLDDYNYYKPDEYPGKDEFTIDMPLAPMVKRVSTDSMTASVYTKTAIGETVTVPSGHEVNAVWSGLQADHLYQWYTVVQDDNSGWTRSPIWSFRTSGSSPEPTVSPSPENTPSPAPSATPSPSPTNSTTPEPTPTAEPSTSPMPTPGPAFQDVPGGHWAEKAINRAAQLGIVNGDGAGQFRPEAGVSRAELVAMLGRALDWSPVSDASTGFIDADRIPAYARSYTAYAVQAGIVSGYADGSFGPTRTMTRAELAVLLARATGLTPSAGAKPRFADVNLIPAWSRDAIAALQEAGLINGVGGNRFAPSEPVTRAQAATLLLRVLDSGAGEP